MATKQTHIFWIFGNLRQANAKWKALCGYIEQHAGVAPNVETVYCGPNPKDVTDSQRLSTMGDVIHVLRTKDMFSTRPRILRVVGIPEDYQDLLHYVDVPTPQNLLVFWGLPGYYKLGSKRWVSLKPTKVFKFIKNHGKVYEFPTEAANENEAVTWAVDVAEEEGKLLTRDTAKLLVRRLGFNLDRLGNSVEQLAIYQADKEITVQDVKACCSETFNGTVWEYINSLDRGDHEKALAYLQRLYEDKPDTGETFYGRLGQILGALRQHFSFLVLAKDASGESVNVKLIEQSAKGLKKFTPTQLAQMQNGETVDLSDWFSGNYVRNKVNNPGFTRVLGHRKSQLYSALRELLFCSFMARQNSGNEAYLRLSLDILTLVLCGKISPLQAAKARGHRRKYSA